MPAKGEMCTTSMKKERLESKCKASVPCSHCSKWEDTIPAHSLRLLKIMEARICLLFAYEILQVLWTYVVQYKSPFQIWPCHATMDWGERKKLGCCSNGENIPLDASKGALWVVAIITRGKIVLNFQTSICKLHLTWKENMKKETEMDPVWPAGCLAHRPAYQMQLRRVLACEAGPNDPDGPLLQNLF